MAKIHAPNDSIGDLLALVTEKQDPATIQKLSMKRGHDDMRLTLNEFWWISMID